MKKMLFFVGLALLPVLALAFSSGPPNGMTGAPGENNCTSCHDSFPVNSGDGNFQISGPLTFEPGQTYQITVTISDPGQRRWGFEITPLNYGTCVITQSAHTQLSMQNGRSYIKHTSAGTFNGTMNGPVSWNFNWTAPVESPEQIIFYAAGNAANGNGNNSGDYIYTTTFVTHLVTDIDDDYTALIPGQLSLANYPNPFNTSTEIRFNLPEAGNATIELYDIAGRLVKTAASGYMNAGISSVKWDGTNDMGIKVSSGIYFVRLATDYKQVVHRLTLVK